MTLPRDNYNSNNRRRNRPLYKDIPFPGQRFLENSHEADIFIRGLIKGYTDRTKEFNNNYYKLGHDLQQSKLNSSRNSCSNTTIEAQEAFPKLILGKCGNRFLDNFIDDNHMEKSAKRSSIDEAIDSELMAQISVSLRDEMNNNVSPSSRSKNENIYRGGILTENECNNKINFKPTSISNTKMKIATSPRINSNSSYGRSPTRPSSAPSNRRYAPHPPTGVSTPASHSSHSISTPRSFTKVTERKLSLMRGDVDSLFQRLLKPERTQEYDPIVRPSSNKESLKPREINPYNKKEKVDFVPEELSSAYLRQYHTAVKLIGSSAPKLSTQSWGDWYWSPLLIEALDEEEQSDSTLSEEIELLIQAMSEVDEKKFHLYFDTSLHLLLELSDELRCPANDHKEFWNAHCHPTSGNFASILSRLTILRDSRALLLELLRVASTYSRGHNSKFDYDTPANTSKSASHRNGIDTAAVAAASALGVKDTGISYASSSSVTSYSSFPDATPTPSVHSRSDAQSETYEDSDHDREEEGGGDKLSCTSHSEREVTSSLTPRPPPSGSERTSSRSDKSKGKGSTSYPRRPSPSRGTARQRRATHKASSSSNDNDNNNHHHGKSNVTSQSIGSCTSSDERWRIRAALRKWMKSLPWKVTDFPFHGKNLVDIYIKK